jgi:transposase
MGNRYLRRLLYLGAMAQVSARRRGDPGDDWLWKIIQRTKPKQAAVALANRMARTVHAFAMGLEPWRPHGSLKNATEYQAAGHA